MYFFLVNPASKSHQGMSIWNEVEQYLIDNKVEFQVYFSKCAGHVKELMYDICSEHLEDKEPINVIILGGDGTYNEAIQGIISFDKVNIGYIPSGSGNDFAKAIGYYDNPVDNIKRILECKCPKKMDVGKVKFETISERTVLAGHSFTSTHYFNTGCGIGFDAAVCERVLESRLKFILNRIGLGKTIYTLTAIKEIFSAKLCDVTLRINNRDIVTVKGCRFIVGMNTCYEGGGFKFAPDANPTDGKLNICTVGDINPFRALTILPLAKKGKHAGKKKINFYTAREYEVTTAEPMWVHTDGEVFVKSNHIKVSVIPGGMNFLW